VSPDVGDAAHEPEGIEDTNSESPVETDAPAATETEAESNVGERRELTVLFSDLSGYTAMNERLDPEDVEDIMQEVIRRGTNIVEKHAGIVNLIVGDELVVLFGIPDAHEDDSFRAVTVALEFHDAIHDFSQEIEKEHGIKLDLHTGIHSGLVVTKHQGSHAGKYNITGDTVNTAARLLGAAETGAILISPRVMHSTEGYFNVEALEPVAMKGKAKKMIPYKVLSTTGATTRLEASLHKGLSEFIGRSKERESITKAFTEIESGHGQFITIMADGGIGKSRLIHEVTDQLDQDKYNMIHGVCVEGKTASYQPFIEIMKSIFKINKSDDQQTMISKIEETVKATNKNLQAAIPIYCHLLAIKDDAYLFSTDLEPDQLTKLYQDNIIQLIIDYSKLKPVVCILDDWQFADSPSDDTLKHLVPVIAQSSVFVLCNYRPVYKANWDESDYHTHLPIKPFTKEETKAMLQSVLKVKRVPNDLVALTFDRTTGNAFYIEELCYALKEQKVIFTDGDEAFLSVKADQIELPDTMQGILTTRIGRLNNATLKMLGHAAVIGITFNHKLLATILDNSIDLDKAVQEAVKEGLIEQIQLTPEPIYHFKQAMAQQIVHDNLLKKTNAKLHEMVAKIIEETHQDDLEQQYEMLAWHYGYSKNTHKAVFYLDKSGDKARNESNAVDAEKHYDNAIKRLNQQHELSKEDKNLFVELCLKLSNYTQHSASEEMFAYMGLLKSSA